MYECVCAVSCELHSHKSNSVGGVLGRGWGTKGTLKAAAAVAGVGEGAAADINNSTITIGLPCSATVLECAPQSASQASALALAPAAGFIVMPHSRSNMRLCFTIDATGSIHPSVFRQSLCCRRGHLHSAWEQIVALTAAIAWYPQAQPFLCFQQFRVFCAWLCPHTRAVGHASCFGHPSWHSRQHVLTDSIVHRVSCKKNSLRLGYSRNCCLMTMSRCPLAGLVVLPCVCLQRAL